MQGRLIQPYLGPKGVVSIKAATAAADTLVTLAIPGQGVVGNDVAIHWIAWSYDQALTASCRLSVTFGTDPAIFDMDLAAGRTFGFIPFPGRYPLFGNGDVAASIVLSAGGGTLIGKLTACTS